MKDIEVLQAIFDEYGKIASDDKMYAEVRRLSNIYTPFEKLFSLIQGYHK